MHKDLSFLNFSDDEERRTVSHALDLAYRAIDSDVCASAFLNVREQNLVKTALESDGSFCFSFFGGYPEFERGMLLCFPEYMAYTSFMSSGFIPCEQDNLPVISDIASDYITLLSISCSSFTTLTHRDYMGALLGLGIERSSIGDIVVNGEHDAFAFVSSKISSFIKSELKTVGRAPVKVWEKSLSDAVRIKQNLHTFDAVSTSLRLDCVVSSLTGISRDKAKSMISSGLVEHNYFSRSKPDSEIASSDIISVRGYGKYRILSTDTKTVKGKFRLKAAKYI